MRPPPIDLRKGFTRIDQAAISRQQDILWIAEWFKHATVAAPFFDVETFFPELVDGGTTQHPAPFHVIIGNPPYGGDGILINLKVPSDLVQEILMAL